MWYGMDIKRLGELMAFATFANWASQAHDNQQNLAEAVLALEALETGNSPEDIRSHMSEALHVMKEAIVAGLNPDIKSRSGLCGGDAARMNAQGAFEFGDLFSRALSYAVATAEVNSSMGRIVAAPTAGASGVVPGVLIAASEVFDKTDDELIDALFVSAGIGGVFAARATLSGAAGGCQAEIGVGASMAAGALTFLMGGTPEQVSHAAALAMQGQLGLVCDPVAGLVEIPCIMRNSTGASVALAGAHMALAGVEFAIPFDEVVVASARVGASLPPTLRETARGGLAVTPTGQCIAYNFKTP